MMERRMVMSRPIAAVLMLVLLAEPKKAGSR
jgi:hypothetical protein